MLAREGEKDKEKDEDFEKSERFLFFYFFLSSQVELKDIRRMNSTTVELYRYKKDPSIRNKCIVYYLTAPRILSED